MFRLCCPLIHRDSLPFVARFPAPFLPVPFCVCFWIGRFHRLSQRASVSSCFCPCQCCNLIPCTHAHYTKVFGKKQQCKLVLFNTLVQIYPKTHPHLLPQDHCADMRRPTSSWNSLTTTNAMTYNMLNKSPPPIMITLIPRGVGHQRLCIMLCARAMGQRGGNVRSVRSAAKSTELSAGCSRFYQHASLPRSSILLQERFCRGEDSVGFPCATHTFGRRILRLWSFIAVIAPFALQSTDEGLAAMSDSVTCTISALSPPLGFVDVASADVAAARVDFIVFHSTRSALLETCSRVTRLRLFWTCFLVPSISRST